MSTDKPKSTSFWRLFDEVPEETGAGRPFSDLLREPADVEREAERTTCGPEEAAQEPNCARDFDPNSVFWAMRNLPVEEATKHFLICGTTGSGKTKTIQLFLQSIAPRFYAPPPGSKAKPEQLILFDAKCDVVPMLDSFGLFPSSTTYILNPYDARSAVWNIAEALQTPAMARSFATLLIPEEKQSTAPYFSDAARELVYAVILGLNKAAGTAWTFRDLLCALDSRAHIEQVAANDERSRILTARILLDERHANGVLSTLGTKLGPYEQVAALWHTNDAGHIFTIKDFLASNGVLVLGNDPVLRSSFWPINAILLKALSNEILRSPNDLPPRRWFVLDEFRAMERVDCIHDLLNRGRSKGVSILLGLQGIDGLIDLYGYHGAEDILSMCANKTFLRAGGPQTAQWAESFFNKVRQFESTTSYTWSSNGSSSSVQYSLNERSMFLASFFLDLPLPEPGGSYVAVSDVPSLREVLIVERPFDHLLQWSRHSDFVDPEKPPIVPAVLGRDDPEGQSLLPWTMAEEAKFCVAPPKKTRKPRTRKKPTARAEPATEAPPPDPPSAPTGLPGRHPLKP